MITILILILLLTLAYWKLAKHYQYWTNRSVKQRKPVFLLGDQAGFFLRKESVFDLVQSLYNSFPDERYIGGYQTVIPVLCVKDIDLIKQITTKDFDHFINHHSVVPEGIDPLWSKNLFVLKDTTWREMRQTLSPSFTSSKMKMMFTLIAECADEFTNYFLEKGGNHTLEMKDTFTRYTNDVIASVAFGIKCDSLNERDNDFFTMGLAATRLGTAAKLKFFLYLLVPKLCQVLGINFIPKDASNFFLNVIRETIQTRESQGITRPDMLQLLLEARKGKTVLSPEINEVNDAGFATVEESLAQREATTRKESFTDLDIAAQALIFFFGGFESASTLMSFTAYELAVETEIQKKLQKEIDQTMNECNGKLTYEILMKMKYMDMVISEVLRKWPVSVGTDRICSKKYTIEPIHPHEKPVHLEPGDFLFIPIMGLHYDPQYFPNPQKFDPERFSDENKASIVPYSYLPFGAGPRNCIGSRFALMETKTIFFYMLSKFNLCICEKTDYPIQLSKKAMQLASENGTWLELQPREK